MRRREYSMRGLTVSIIMRDFSTSLKCKCKGSVVFAPLNIYEGTYYVTDALDIISLHRGFHIYICIMYTVTVQSCVNIYILVCVNMFMCMNVFPFSLSLFPFSVRKH